MKFNSQIQNRGSFKADWNIEDIKNEPMFFNCNLDYAYQHGGPITKEFILKLPHDWWTSSNLVLDSRVHMLMKNWYPCIPGWHHDDIPRSTSTGQPNYLTPEYRAEHLSGLVNAEICPTTFIIGPVEVSEPDINTRIYNRWHDEIETMSHLEKYQVKSGEYIQFNGESFHSGVKAIDNGWRWFIRLSRNTGRQNKITNEIRRQVQVYLEHPTEGW